MKKMKILTFLMLSCICFFNTQGQVFSGVVLNQETGAPVPFVNIGVIGKNIGTVSDTAGRFLLKLDSGYDQDSLCFSSVGYTSRKYSVLSFREIFARNDRVRIALSPKMYKLEEVIVRPSDTKVYTLGNYCEGGSAYGNAFYSGHLGTEMGVVVNLPRKDKVAYLKNFRFYVGELTYRNFPVRLNLYNLNHGKPHENILKEPIYITLNSKGEYIVDLEKYHIKTEEDFFISLEYFRIADQKEGRLIFCAVHNKKGKGNSYYRLTSHGDWQKERFDSVGFSVQVEVLQ